jgi:class 3 adenylate cyclase
MDDVLDQRVQDLLADAEAEAERKAWDRARALANAVLALDPHNGRALQLVESTERTPEADGEWRQLTVMFCDLVGSTSLSERLSAEAYRDVLLRYQQVCDDVITRHGGRIGQYQGDGILAYFGHPTAHEDDAHRGVRAGLEIPSEFGPVAHELSKAHDAAIALRVAVHTGMVVVGAMGTSRNPEPVAIVGEATNLAARLQDHARPNSMVISGSTYDLVRGFFIVERRGPVQLRGLSRPVDVFEVVGEGLADTRIDAAPQLSPFVGRTEELRELETLWRRASEGGSAVALVVGDPGIGKTRLADVMRRRVADRGAATLAAWCSPQHTSSHLWAARRLVEFACAVSPRSNPEDATRRIARSLAVDGQEDALPLFVSLLGLPEELAPAPELAPGALREATMDALLTWITRAAAREPRLLLVDDLQWADPSTLELLGRVIAAKAPGLFLVLTCRAGVSLPWPDAAVDTIELGPLSRDELELVAAGSAAGKDVSASGLDAVIDRSDGVPLYFEELLLVAGRPVEASRSVVMAWKHDLPPSLIGPLLARVESPGVDTRLLQTMAVIGQEVPGDLLTGVVDMAPDALADAVAHLERTGLIERAPQSDEDDGAPPTYRFHHRLLWELVYGMQLLPARVERHARVADALIARAGSFDEADGAVLGPHLEQAIRSDQAVRAFINAARRGMSGGAVAEVDQTLDHALELLDSVVDEEERLSLELTIRQLRGLAATTQLGYLAPNAIAEHERCLEICQRLPSRPEYLPSAMGVWIFYLLKGDLDRADGVLDAQAERMGEAWPGIDVEAGCRQMVTFFRGNVPKMIREAELYLASPHPLMDDAHNPYLLTDWPNPTDPVAVSLSFLAVASMLDGRWADAEVQMKRAAWRAADWPFPYGPFTRALISVMAALTHREAGDIAGARAAAREAVAIGERHGIQFWTIAGNMTLALDPELINDAGHEDLMAGRMTVWRFTGVDAWTPAFLVEQAKLQLLAGNVEGALTTLEQSRELAHESGGLLYAAETERLRGEAQLRLGDASGVERIADAVGIAAEQGTKLFELRARTALRRHDPAREDGKALAALLAEIEQGGPMDSPLAPRADIDAARAALG